MALHEAPREERRSHHDRQNPQRVRKYSQQRIIYISCKKIGRLTEGFPRNYFLLVLTNNPRGDYNL